MSRPYTEGPTIEVNKEALLMLVRTLDFGADYDKNDFSHAFDALRCAFTPDEVATGELSDA